MSKQCATDNVCFILYDGDIYLIKDKLIQLTKGYKISYLKKTKNTKNRIYFRYDNIRFYYDKKEEIIYFTKYKGDKR